MEWIRSLQNAIQFIEDNLLGELGVEEIAARAFSSGAHFQRLFSIVTGMTVGDYIRFRRLSLAGRELADTRAKALDVALKYGYETAESFTKAFARFHGVTPSAAKRRAAELKQFAPLSIRIDVRGGFIVHRKLIPGVPVIPYDGNNAAFFITLLEAVLRGLGEDCDRSQLVALSGEGNRFCWTDGAWAFGNEVTESINGTPFETEYRVLTAIGWRARYVTVQRGGDGNFLNTDAAQIRRDFVDSIDRGFPVLIRYIEHADCDLNVFFGYEDDGRRIVGYPYNSKDGAGTPAAWENWERNLAGYILLQKKTASASERGAALAAFRFISHHARRTGEIRGRKVGFAAWESFLRHLECDDFSALHSGDLANRFIIYCDALCQIYARKEPLPYYRSLAERFPEWRDELTAAIEALDACAAYGGFLWSQGFSFDEAGFEKFRAPEARKILADAGREAMRRDRDAVELFEKILEGGVDVHPIEKLVETITYKGVEMEVVERPDVIWVGCVDYADNNQGESDIGATLRRYREELIEIPKREEINPDWSAALSINYTRADKPCGIMFAQETYSGDQDARYDLFTQPGGLWLKIKNDTKAAALLGKESAAPYEYFAEARVLQKAAQENGYAQNPDVHVQVEYHCHAEYNTPPHTNYAYIPVIRNA